jgi:hypothetical protein
LGLESVESGKDVITMGFEFATATRVIFGHGAAKEAGSIGGKMGRRAFMVTGRSLEMNGRSR